MTQAKTYSYLAAVTAVALTALGVLLLVAPSGAKAAEFGIVPGTFRADVFNQDGSFATQAGSHPNKAVTEMAFTLRDDGYSPVETLKDVDVTLPAGFIGNPQAVPMCSREAYNRMALLATADDICPVGSQIGVLEFQQAHPTIPMVRVPIYNVQPRRGVAADFGMVVAQVPVRLEARVTADGGYRLQVGSRLVPEGTPINYQRVIIWGVPSDPSHDVDRGCGTGFPLNEIGCTTDRGVAAFLTNPTSCQGPQTSHVRVNSWVSPEWVSDSYTTPTGISRCASVPFEPSIEVDVSAGRADSPVGLDVKIDVPQTDRADTLGSAHLDDAVVRFPAGVDINPAAADGLQACTMGQMGVVGTAPLEFNNDPAACPDASRIGSVRVDTPLLGHELQGTVYQAVNDDPLEPGAENPFDSFVAIYAVVDDPESGTRFKLAGQIEPQDSDGRLVATFNDSPQLPFNQFEMRMRAGERAPLVAPRTCGIYEVDATLRGWNGVVRDESSRFTIDRGPDGGPCLAGDPSEPGDPADLADRPFDPGVQGGLMNATAGGSSPFVLKVTRPDGEQELTRMHVDLPPGLTARLAGVSKCADATLAGISDARGAGEDEMNAPSCPANSRIGRATIGVGAGASPHYLQTAKIYLAGPLDPDGAGPKTRAPLSMAIVTPAVAGPFDLGNVVTRTALYVDPDDAQVHADDTEIPEIRHGIPFRIRDIRIVVDRPGFMLSPSSCAPKQVAATLTSAQAATSQKSHRFQVADCQALPFKPKLALSLTGRKQTTTGKHPGIKAKVAQKGIGGAGIEKAEVRLPKSLALDPDNAQALCEFEDGTKPDLENHCPKGSIVGRARAKTPLLDDDLVGNVYFVKNVRVDKKTGNKIRTLPMIVVALRGEIAINLTGESSTTKDGKLVNTFDNVPDAPVSQFNLNINGGKNGILAVTRTRKTKLNLCTAKQTATVALDSHNGKQRDFKTGVKTPCAKKTKKAKRGKK